MKDSTLRGFTMISMIFILVVLAALGAALSRLSLRQHLGSASELAAAKAMQSAVAGLEWAAFQTLNPALAPACFGNINLPLTAGLADFTVSLTCSRSSAVDGSATLTFYQLVATACNAPLAGVCPGSATPQATYVERQLSRTLVRL